MMKISLIANMKSQQKLGSFFLVWVKNNLKILWGIKVEYKTMFRIGK